MELCKCIGPRRALAGELLKTMAGQHRRLRFSLFHVARIPFGLHTGLLSHGVRGECATRNCIGEKGAGWFGICLPLAIIVFLYFFFISTCSVPLCIVPVAWPMKRRRLVYRKVAFASYCRISMKNFDHSMKL